MDRPTTHTTAGFAVLVSLLSIACACPASQRAHGTGEHAVTVVPEKEKELARDHHLEGPTATVGIEAVKALVSLPLGQEFRGMSGIQLRARELVLKPGAAVAVHQHDNRPGFAYILEGEIVEVRNDRSGPILRRAGDVAVERTGVSHFWENRSGDIVRALVVDLVPVSK